MSALARQTDEAARAFAAERARSAGRARRSEAAGVAEMARSLMRDARAARESRQNCRPGAVGAPGRSAGAPLQARRRRPRGGSPRLAPAPIALRRS